MQQFLYLHVTDYRPDPIRVVFDGEFFCVQVGCSRNENFWLTHAERENLDWAIAHALLMHPLPIELQTHIVNQMPMSGIGRARFSVYDSSSECEHTYRITHKTFVEVRRNLACHYIEGYSIGDYCVSFTHPVEDLVITCDFVPEHEILTTRFTNSATELWEDVRRMAQDHFGEDLLG